jgi:hypothetical protein
MNKHAKIVLFLGALLLCSTYLTLMPIGSCQTSLGDQLSQFGQQLGQSASQAANQASQAASSWGQQLSQQASQAANQASQAASSWGQQVGQQAAQAAQQAGSSLSQQAQQAADNLNQQASQTLNQASQQGAQAMQSMDEWVNQVTQVAGQNIQQAVEMAKQSTGTYGEQAWSVVSLEAQRNLCSKYTDPETVGLLNERRGLITEVALTAIKLVPVYDEEKGQVETFDGFARNMVSQTPALAGSDLGQDPVRCASLMVLDGNYLNYAKIIQTPDGNWISIEQAQTQGYRTSDVNSAQSDLTSAKQAYENNDSQQIDYYLTNFSSKINQINNNQSPEPPINNSQNQAQAANTQTTNAEQSSAASANPTQGSIGTEIIDFLRSIPSLILMPPTRWFVLIGIVIAVATIGASVVRRKSKESQWSESI